LPKVADIWQDFATRNLIVEVASNDHWLFHKKEFFFISDDSSPLASNELRIFTMTMELCARGIFDA
jgi:hypothetical protein